MVPEAARPSSTVAVLGALGAESKGTGKLTLRGEKGKLITFFLNNAACAVSWHVTVPVPLMIPLTLELIDLVKILHVGPVLKKYQVSVPPL